MLDARADGERLGLERDAEPMQHRVDRARRVADGEHDRVADELAPRRAAHTDDAPVSRRRGDRRRHRTRHRSRRAPRDRRAGRPGSSGGGWSQREDASRRGCRDRRRARRGRVRHFAPRVCLWCACTACRRRTCRRRPRRSSSWSRDRARPAASATPDRDGAAVRACRCSTSVTRAPASAEPQRSVGPARPGADDDDVPPALARAGGGSASSSSSSVAAAHPSARTSPRDGSRSDAPCAHRASAAAPPRAPPIGS